MADAPIVLVPGFWLGAWAWDEVVELLRADGHDVTALTLPGLESVESDRSSITFNDHVEAVCDPIRAKGSPVVLAVHSGTGGVGYAVTDRIPDLIAHMVYVDTGAAPRALDPDFEDAKRYRDDSQTQLNIGATGIDPSARPTFETFDPAALAQPGESPQLSAEEFKIQRVRELVTLGEQYLEYQFYEEAQDHFEQVLLIAPDNERAKIGLHEATLGLYSKNVGETQGRVPREGFRLISGEELIRVYRPAEDAGVKAFCTQCGSSLFGRTWPDGPEISVRLGALDGDPGIRPQFHTYVESRAPWEVLPDDGLPRYPDEPPR